MIIKPRPIVRVAALGGLAWAMIAYTIHPANDIANVCASLHSTPAFPRSTMTVRSKWEDGLPLEDERQPDHPVFVPTLEECWGDFLDAVTSVESGGNANAENPISGARGLMQITEATWGDMTHEPWSRAFEPELNRIVGSAYLRWCRSYLHRPSAMNRKPTVIDILCCYHAGPGNYRRGGWQYENMGPQTQEYVCRVLSELDRRLYAREVQGE